MKLKKLFVAAALALGLGVGAVAGISANKDSMKVDAAGTRDIYVCIAKSNWQSWNANLATDGDVKVHYFGGASASTYPGVLPTEIVTHHTVKFAKFEIPADSTKIVVNSWGGEANAHDKTVDISLEAGKSILYIYNPTEDGNMPAYWAGYTDFDAETTTYLYDVSNYYAGQGGAKIFTWGGTISGPAWPGIDMAVANASYHGGTLYSYTHPCVYEWTNCLFVHDGDANKTGDLFYTMGNTYVYNKRHIEDSWPTAEMWCSDSVRDEAVSFVYDKMKMDSYDPDLTGSKTMGCLEYFSAAETAYGNLDSTDISVIDTIDPDGNVWARLSKWAEANGRSFSKGSGFSGGANKVAKFAADSTTNIWVVSISLLALMAGVGAFYALKKRKAFK